MSSIPTIPSIVKENEVTLFIDGNTKVINSGHMNYAKIREALVAEDFDRVRTLINVAARIAAFGDGKVTVDGGVVMYQGRAMHNTLTMRILSMEREGFNIGPMAAYMGNLLENPSFRAVNELYGFMEKTDLPITEDGYLIAYKQVRNDYTSIHASPDGTHMDNSIGTVPEMPRYEVDDDKDTTCSKGLHFCSQNYLGKYGGGSDSRTMILKINPRDVVSIPTDYQNSKGRACKYEVIGELEDRPTKEHSFKTPVFTESFGADMASDNYSLLTINETADALGIDRDTVLNYLDEALLEKQLGDDGDYIKTYIKWYDGMEYGGYPDLADFSDDAGDAMHDARLANDILLGFADAAAKICGDAMNPEAALRKRIARGTVTVRSINGIDMVVLPT